jgi:replicative DNA helicase Mcm
MSYPATSNPVLWDKLYRRSYHATKINAFVAQFPDTESLYLDFGVIDRFNRDLADELLTDPENTIADAEKALVDFAAPAELSGARIRIYNIPEHSHTPIRHIRSEHVDTIVQVDGLIRMATGVYPMVRVAAFACGKCGEVVYIDQPEQRLVEPYTCPSGCNQARFRFLLEESTFEDVQRIKVQEMPESLRGGEQPHSLDATLRGELAGMATPGEHVQLVCILRARQQVTRYGRSAAFDFSGDVNHIEILDKNFADVTISPANEKHIAKLAADPQIYTKIVDSIAPAVEGYRDIKEAIALLVMGGVPKDISGNRQRGDIHILLIGDPGVAKSELLQYTAMIAPRGIYTSGRSASASGLTAACVRDELNDGGWTIEAGALVVADQGIACIDEMDKMRPTDRDAIHEAMSIQTVSIAKAGIMATLKSRCAVLGAANPKYGRFDPHEGLPQQIKMGPALLSRFDLIFAIEDIPNRDHDTAIAQRILDACREDEPADIDPPILPEMLRMYAARARQIRPRLDHDAALELQQYYVDMRLQGIDRDAPMPATARQMGALIRLTEASARMRLSGRATIDDAHHAIRITEAYLQQVARDPGTGLPDIDRIVTGTSRSQRDRNRTLRDIIADIGQDHGGVASIELVMAEAVARGIDTALAEQTITELLKERELMAVTGGLQLARS